MFEEREELEERLGVFSRLEENEDFIKAIKLANDEFDVDKSPMSICNLPNAEHFLWCREGVRLALNWLTSQKTETEEAIKDLPNQGDIDE